MSNTQLTEILNKTLDDFQMVVGSGKTTSVYTNKLFTFNFHPGSHEMKGNIDIQSDFDGLYPINLWEEEENYVGIKDHRSKEILMDTPVSDKEKETIKEWFLSGGDNYEYGEDLQPYRKGFKMDYKTWWRFTKGLLWRFYYYLLVNIRDENLETIDEEWSMVLMDMIFYHNPPIPKDLTDEELGLLIQKGYTFFPGLPK